MYIRNFQDLNVWQKSHQVVLEIYKVTKHYPAEEKFGLITQIRRSSISVSANIAEGFKKSTKDFIRYIEIAQGSLEETKYHLILSRDLEYLMLSDFTKIYNLSDDISKMLFSLNKKLELRLTSTINHSSQSTVHSSL